MLSVVKNEQQVLNCVLSSPELIHRFDRGGDYFLSDMGRELFNAVQRLYDARVEITLTNIVIEGNAHHKDITEDNLERLKAQEFSVDSFDYYFRTLKENYAKSEITEHLLNDTLKTTATKDGLDVDKLRSLITHIEDNLDILAGKESVLLNTTQMVGRYREELHKRAKGQHKFSTGCPHIDRHLVTGFIPSNISILFAATGIGKSAYALNLINRQINRFIPSLYLSLEMDTISTMDRLLAMRLSSFGNSVTYPMKLFYPDENGVLPEFVFDLLQKEAKVLEEVKHFMFIEQSGISIYDLPAIVKEAKRKMGTDYMVLTVDLLTMLKEFSGGDAKEYEYAMNELYRVIKPLNVHLFGVVQGNRATDSANITSLDDIDRLRPNNINTIKNSHALAERSRLVLSAFRPKYYAQRLFPDDPLVEIMDDVMDIQILKQNQGRPGKVIKYLYDAETFSMIPYVYDEFEQEMTDIRRESLMSMGLSDELD